MLLRTSEHSYRSFDNTEIYYEKCVADNSYPTVIFLHGMGGDLTAWEKERKKLNSLGFSTIAVDLRGHGLSGRPDNLNSYDLHNFSKDIVGLIKHERIRKPVLIGHCFGGMIALLTAAFNPNLLKALIIIDTGYKPPQISRLFSDHETLRSFISLIMKYLPELHLGGHIDYNRFIKTSDYNWKRIVSDIAHVSLRSYLMIWSNLINYDATFILKKITIPCAIIEGLDDTVFPPEVARILHKRILNSELHMIKNANHILVLNNPDDLIYEIQTFLKKFVNIKQY